MPTLNKLEYLDETKKQIKNALNTNFNSQITDEDTFRSYVSKINVIYDNWSKVTGEDTSITLNNTKKGKMLLATAPSELTQETTTGKSLYDFINNTYTTEGTITVNKLSSGYTLINNTSSEARILFSGVTVDSSKNYVISLEISNSSGVNVRIGWAGSGKMIGTTATSGKVAQTFSGITTSVFSIYCPANSTITITNLMVYEGTDTTIPYEPYTGGIPQPNPSYPSEVQAIKGNNSIKIENKNLFSETDFATSMSPNITVSETTYQSETVLYINPSNATKTTYNINCKPNTQYILTLDIACALGTGNAYLFMEYSDGTNSNITLSNLTSSFVSKTITSTNGKTVTGISLVCYAVQSNKYYFKNIMLRESSATSDYVAHQEQVLPLNLPNGIEYCKIGTYEDEFEHDGDKWYLNKYIGNVVLDGSENWTERTNSGGLNQFNHNTGITNYLAQNVSDFQKSNYGIYRYSTYNYGAIGTFIFNNTFSINVPSDLTLTQFKQNLENENLICYYPLATPTHEEITDTTLINQLNAIEQAVSYDEQTNISQTNTDLPFIISASALMKGGN